MAESRCQSTANTSQVFLKKSKERVRCEVMRIVFSTTSQFFAVVLVMSLHVFILRRARGIIKDNPLKTSASVLRGGTII